MARRLPRVIHRVDHNRRGSGMSEEEWNKAPQRRCICGTILSKYTKGDICSLCKRKGKINGDIRILGQL